MAEILKIGIEVNGGTTGVKREPGSLNTGGKQAPKPNIPTKGITAGKVAGAGATGSLLNLSKLQAGAGSALAIANFASNHIKTDYALRGADHQAEKAGKTMSTVNTGALLLFGASKGPLGFAITLGITAYQIAQQNKRFIKTIELDQIQSTYYAQRVTQDISERR